MPGGDEEDAAGGVPRLGAGFSTQEVELLDCVEIIDAGITIDDEL